MPLPTNPYSANVSSHDLTTIQCRISPADLAYLRALCPRQGILDVLLSNLFLAFLNELRSHNLSTDDRAWHPEHATNRLIADIISRVAFPQHAAGDPAGCSSPRHDSGAIGGLRQDNGSEEEQCADASRGTEKGGGEPRSGEDDKEVLEEKGRQRESRTRPVVAVERDPLEELRKLGIL